MLVIKSIDVKPNFSSFYLISWTIQDTTELVEDYSFAVYTASAPTPPTAFTKISPDIVGFSFVYELPNKLNSSIHEYFRIGVTELATDTTVLSDVVGASYLVPPDAYADAIIYQEQYFLENILGRPPVKLFMRRRTGTRCPVCWDDDLLEVTRSSCDTCYSTGYLGGYSVPQELFISFTEPAFQTKFDVVDIKNVQNVPTYAWASNYPLILPDDILVDEFNRRFRVIQSQPTTKDGRIYLRQNLQLQLLPPTDISYSLGVV